MGLIRGLIDWIVMLGVVSCEFEGALVTRVSRAGAGDGFGSWATVDEMIVCLSRGCGVGVSLNHGEIDDVVLSARGLRGMGEAVGLTVGFTIRYSFLSCSA